MVNWNIEGGSVFLIMFKTGHALPLVKTRFSCPRVGRGQGRGWLRNMYCSWPQTRPVRELEQPSHRAHKRVFSIHKRSTLTFNSWQQIRLQTARIRDDAMATKVRNPAAAMAIKSPQAIRSRDLSTPANSPRISTIRELQLVKNSSGATQRLVHVMDVQSPGSHSICPIL
jgi:hypothetical protein